MTWSLIGWSVIGLAGVSLIVFRFLFQNQNGYRARRIQAVENLTASQISALERGKKRILILGHQLWSQTYPGLGLQTLSTIQHLVSKEQTADGEQRISTSNGGMLALVRQIVTGVYSDGFSKTLSNAESGLTVPGLTPLSFTAGILSTLKSYPNGSIALFGHYGPEAVLWTEAVADRSEHTFAAAGTLTSQAALFPGLHDLLIAEEVYMLPGLLKPTVGNQVALLVEDLLRILLFLLLIGGSILKIAGVL
jgi:hypothetical protein